MVDIANPLGQPRCWTHCTSVHTAPTCSERSNESSCSARSATVDHLLTMRHTTSHSRPTPMQRIDGCSAMSASALHACVGTHAHSPSTHSPSGACHGCFRRRCRACLVRSGLVRPQLQLRAELHSAESNAYRSSCRCSAALSAGCSSAQTPSHRRNSPPTHSSAHRLTRSPRHSCLTRLLTQVAPARPHTGPCLGLRACLLLSDVCGARE